MDYKKILLFFILIFQYHIIFGLGEQEVIRDLPPRPPFNSVMISPEDSGTVKPVDIRPEEPVKIAVLGLENNPFWINVKEGALTAAEELTHYNCTVDWIVPGDQHTSDVFSAGIEMIFIT